MTRSAILVVAGLTVATGWSLAIGWADFQINRDQVAVAVSAVPDNAEYLSRMVEASPYDPGRTASLLHRATSLNPWDSPSWIELGLLAERNRDYSQAETFLLHAAEIDRQYQPRWSLANFYFRRQAPKEFWAWARSAITLSNTDPEPVLRLCGRMTEDGQLIERAGIRDPVMQASYLNYLLGQNRPDLLHSAVQHLIENHRLSDVPSLLAAIEQILGARQNDDAVQLWRRLAGQSMLPWPSADDAGNLLSNSRFSAKPTGRGFDWRLVPSDGVGFSLHQGLDLEFSGEEPEHLQALTQIAPVEGGRNYKLKAELQAGSTTLNGFAWYVSDVGTGALLQSGDIASGLIFETPPKCRLVDLALRYNRPSGSTRCKGTLSLKSVSLLQL